MIFMGDMDMRSKFNCIIADEITPKLPAYGYMDKDDMENELKQVLGDIWSSHDLTDEDVIIIGRDGILLGGPNARCDLQLLIAYIGLLCREMFVRNYFVRTFVLNSLLGRIRDRIMKVNHDPNNITRIRDELAVASRQIILLREVLLYLTESLDHYKIPPMTDDEYDIGSRRLYKVLDPTTMKNDVMLRCDDLKKLIEGANNVQMTLQLMSDQINSTSLENVFKSVESNTKFLVDASAANERASASLEVMQVRAAELRSGVGLGSCFVVWGAERGRVVVVAQPP